MLSFWVLKYLREIIEKKNAGYFVLIDPEKCKIEKCSKISREIENAGADAILVGGSLLTCDLHPIVESLKKETTLPIILFPGDSTHLTPHADAILYMSLISGRNPNYLIGEQVKAAPLIQRYSLEPIPTGYILIDGGNRTAVEFMSGTFPIPRDKPDIVGPHALAAEYLGMKLVYLEAGSGADLPVPKEMVSYVKKQINIPLIVGGGIRTPDMAQTLVNAGADFIVTGNILEEGGSTKRMKEFANAIQTG